MCRRPAQQRRHLGSVILLPCLTITKLIDNEDENENWRKPVFVFVFSCNVRTVIASERLYHAEGAHNTTQAVGAVWCVGASCRQPLGERRHRCSLQHFLPDETSHCRLSSTGILIVTAIVTALRLRLVRCYVRLSARPVSPTLPLALSNYELSSDSTTHIPP